MWDVRGIWEFASQLPLRVAVTFSSNRKEFHFYADQHKHNWVLLRMPGT